MAYRNIFISSPAKISVANEQLIVETDVKNSVPIEDIISIMLESRQSTITGAALGTLASEGVALFVCDEKHLPCGVLLPAQSHSRQLRMLKAQISAAKPQVKNLWAQIVKAKIKNQSAVLKNSEKNGSEKLEILAEKVLSGDSKNVEATAAAAYYRFLFGDGFSRGEESSINASLNYGFAILRGAVARALVTYGFEVSLGIFHHSELNRFNLADDLIEPFRPIVDLYVINNIERLEGKIGLETNMKTELFNLLNVSILMGGQKHSVAYAIELCVQSFSRAMQGEGQKLNLPVLIPLRQHEYL